MKKEHLHPDNVSFYDLIDDWPLIESSLFKQYGIRIRHNADMCWDEFSTLLSGIMPDTPLGSIVSIRAETDSATIKKFNKHQKKIYNDWKKKKALEVEETQSYINELDSLARALAGLM